MQFGDRFANAEGVLELLGTAAKADIQGVVSQSSGSPTGDICEFGSNANGSYVRYAAGLQVAWLISENVEAIYQDGEIFRSTEILCNYPSGFSSSARPVAAVAPRISSQRCWGAFRHSTTSVGFLTIYSSIQATIETACIAVVGRWI